MKKLLNTSVIYLAFALVSGVFYREFTKWNGFTGYTSLSVLHTHLFVLGVFLFLILILFVRNHQDVLKGKKFKRFFILHNIALPFFWIMLLVRGIVQVLNIELNSSMNAMIAGIAGVSHILLTISLIFFVVILYEVIKKEEK